VKIKATVESKLNDSPANLLCRLSTSYYAEYAHLACLCRCFSCVIGFEKILLFAIDWNWRGNQITISTTGPGICYLFLEVMARIHTSSAKFVAQFPEKVLNFKGNGGTDQWCTYLMQISLVCISYVEFCSIALLIKWGRTYIQLFIGDIYLLQFCQVVPTMS